MESATKTLKALQTSKTKSKIPDAYIIDSYKSLPQGLYHAGAILFRGRRRVETLQWHDCFATDEEARQFVRSRCSKEGLAEAADEAELVAKNPR